ncbi:MAG: hypothetical protein IT565_12520 [Rhodospirillales bacterium]|nr:hypothetical protein [Rhodospirillales bacterium]
MDELDVPKRDWVRGVVLPWLALAVVNAPIWIWQDGRYGIVKALFFALAFALMQRIKRNLFDVAIFSLLMTILHVFSRQVVNYHALVFETEFAAMMVFALLIVATVLAAGLYSWLFQLAETDGPSYPQLASLYITFFLVEYIGHALVVQIMRSYPISLGKLVAYIALGLMPWALGWLVRRVGAALHEGLEARTAVLVRARAFENTRFVVMSCLALYAVQVVWFGFVYFAIGKLGATAHFQMAPGCPALPELTDFLRLSLAATVGLDTSCLAAASLPARAIEYLEMVVTVLLVLVVVQAVALARRAARAQDTIDNERS